MAVLDHIVPNTPGFLSRIGNAIIQATMSFAEARSRSAEVEYYQAMSDEELQARGLRRDDIVRHVFRDQISF